MTSQEDDYTTGCLLGYPYFKDNCKLIAIGSNKQQMLDADPKANQQINFTGNLVKETVLDFSQGTLKYCRFVL